jgi:HPt (histidine-containing phosphotransfer) domain-containing protein
MNPQICNLDQLKAMTGDDVGIMKEFIKMYLKDTPILEQKILEAKARGQFIGEDGVAWCCHKIAPQLSYMGMNECHELARNIEAKLKSLDGVSYPELDADLAIIHDYCEKSYAELNAFMEAN